MRVALAEPKRILSQRPMQLSPQQDDALQAVARWLKAGKPQIFRLFGYAGTGKTTLARYFASHVDGQVQFAAFTGKAAQVLRSKGATNARTIHSLIYRPRGEEAVADEVTGKTSMSPTFSLNRQSPVSRAKLVIVDECSMPIWQDRLFIQLARTAADATEYFQIPTGRVVEIGTQVAI